MKLPPAQIIYIYNGPGTSLVASNQAEYTLKKLSQPRYEILQIGPQEVCQGNWTQTAALFVMPGGTDLAYCQYLNGEGNRQINNYVRQGGAFLGFCAGAYYASHHVNFAVGTPLEVIGDRELAFFLGIAAGPTLGSWDDKSNAGAKIAVLEWNMPNGNFAQNKTFLTYSNGGGHFVRADTFPHVTVLANYVKEDMTEAAIIKISHGQGRVILSGVHCEFCPTLFDSQDPFLRPLIDDLISHDQDRVVLMSHLLDLLGIETQ